MRVFRSKDGLAGLIYVAIAGVALWIAKDYSVGRAGRMGPGYFPIVIAAGLLVLGLLAIGRGWFRQGEILERVPVKALALISLSLVLFGALLQPAGFLIALAALLVVSASASAEFRFDPKIVAGLVGFVAVCAVIFVKLLGLPMPLFGTWITPLLPFVMKL